MLLWPRKDECCCGPCCAVARVEVRKCDRGVLVAGASVAILKEGDESEPVASGETDETGTVALSLPDAGGQKYVAEVSLPGEAEPTRKHFSGACGVNTIEVDSGAVREICINVVDSDTGSPVSGIPAVLSLVRPDGSSRTIAPAVSDGGGRACFAAEAGGEYLVNVNGVPAGETDPDTDYYAGSALLEVPNCGPFEQDVPIRLLDDHPGCLEIITRGCWCFLPGVTLTFHVHEIRGLSPFGYVISGVTPVETDHVISATSDAAGRAWFCLGEELGLISLETGLYYDDDTDENVKLTMTSVDVVPPSPYVPYMGIPPNTSNGGYYATTFGLNTHSWTPFPGGPNGVALSGAPPYRWCGQDCTGAMPEEITGTISGTWPAGFPATITLTRDASSATPLYVGCVDSGPGSSYVLRVYLPWSPYECGDFDPDGGGAELYRVGKACASGVVAGSERVFDLRGVAGSGTTACPVDFQMRSFTSVMVDGDGVVVDGDAYLAVSE